MMKGRQMKKYLAGALLALSMILLTSCEGFDKPEKKPDTFGTATNGIYLSADLTVRDCMLADFDTQKYNDKEYQGFLQEDLDVYNAAHPYTDSEGQKISAISIEKCDASSNILTQILKYYNASDFLAYNQQELQERSGSILKTGTLSTPAEDIFSFSFVLPDGSADVVLDELVNSKEAGSYRYMICDLQAVLYGEGEIAAVSKGAVYTPDLNCVSSPGGTPVAVIFK